MVRRLQFWSAGEITKIPCFQRDPVSNERLNFNRPFDVKYEVCHAGDGVDAADR